MGSCTSCIGDFIKSFQGANHEKALSILRVSNFINAALIIFVGIFSLFNIGDILTLKITAISVSIYLICFGCVLGCYETRLKMFEAGVRKRFGFMYTSVGRALFLIFVASLCFSRSTIVSYIIGGITVINALLNFFVMLKFGSYLDDPTQKYTTAESNASQYIQSNPQIASAAFNTAATYAVNNPQTVATGMNYVRENAGNETNAYFTNSRASEAPAYSINQSSSQNV